MKKIIIGSVVAAFLLIFSIIFSFINMGSDKIIKNIKVQDVNLGELTRKEANEKLTKIFNEKKSNEIELVHNDFSINISYDQLNVINDINKIIDEAYSIGRNGNIIANNYTILFTSIFGKKINYEMKINEEVLNKVVDDVESKLPDVTKEGSYYIEDENLIILKGKDGVRIDKERLKNNIKDRINQIENTNGKIEIPVKQEKAKEIDFEKIVSEISKEPKDAYVSKNPVKVSIEEKGIKLAVSKDEAKKILQEDKEEYIIPLQITEPSITVASLGEDAFVDKLARYTTKYDASNINRNNNLNLAAEKLNETIINPGEVFSYNKTIGQRTVQAGFKEANAYAGGKVVLDVGGGICQLSSTLYNAVLLVNLDIVERHNHQFAPTYVPEGQDATVSWETVDFKFKNNRQYPIKIISEAKEGVVSVEIYGIKEKDDCQVLIESKVTNIIKKQTQYINDYSKAEGEEEIIQYGEDGCTSETYKTVIENGIVKEKTLINKDTYSQMPMIIKKKP